MLYPNNNLKTPNNHAKDSCNHDGPRADDSSAGTERHDWRVTIYGDLDKHPSQKEDDEGHRALREAAEELFRGMPPFEPGRQNGKPVRVQMTRTVNYDLK